jgi:hypothetical protein
MFGIQLSFLVFNCLDYKSTPLVPVHCAVGAARLRLCTCCSTTHCVWGLVVMTGTSQTQTGMMMFMPVEGLWRAGVTWKGSWMMTAGTVHHAKYSTSIAQPLHIHTGIFQRKRHCLPEISEFPSRSFYISSDRSRLNTNVPITQTFFLRSFRRVKLLYDLYKKKSTFFQTFFCVTRFPKLHVKGPKLSTVSRELQLTVLRRGWDNSKAES